MARQPVTTAPPPPTGDVAQASQLRHEGNRKPEAHATSRAPRKTRVGEVVSDRMNKTIVVQTVTRVPHPRFGKIVKQMKKFYAHDEENKAKTGDTVRIMETRPMSKSKRWRLVEVLHK